MVLVGPRAAGKTTVGRVLAEFLGWGFADGDERLRALAGEPAGEHLRRVGEAAFRRLEERASVPLLAAASRQVVALGGGAVLSDRVRRELGRPGLWTAFLFAPPEVLAARIAAAPELRPPLTSLRPEDEVAALLAARAGHYRRAAAAGFDTSVQSPAEIAEAIAAAIAARR